MDEEKFITINGLTKHIEELSKIDKNFNINGKAGNHKYCIMYL